MHNKISTKYNLILGSSSARRKKLLNEMGFVFSIIYSEEEEVYPIDLELKKVASYLAEKKSDHLYYQLEEKDLLITADTTVIANNKILNKPKDNQKAENILKQLSNNTHSIITGVCLRTKDKKITFSEQTTVKFYPLNKEDIRYYIKTFNPYDKAGSYGIQEWIGHIGIKHINGSYTNAVGLPTSKLYQKLNEF